MTLTYKEKIDKTLELIKTAMDYLEKKRLEHENLDAQVKPSCMQGSYSLLILILKKSY